MRAGAAIAILSLPVLLAAGAAASPGPSVDRRVLANGVRLLVSEQHARPMIVVQVLVDAGARRDPAGKEGLASLTADLLTEGTRSRSAAKIKDATDFIGASLGAGADMDFATVSLGALSKDLDTALGLLVEVLRFPSFPEAEVVRRREAALASMKSDEDDPGEVARRAFSRTVFPGQPYGHPLIGDPDTVRRLTRRDVVAFFQENFRPERTIITVAGDVDVADIARRMEAALAGWGVGTAPAFVYPDVRASVPQTVRISKPISQANILMGHRGIARDNPDYYAITVMNFILGGGGFTSRLLEDIRTKAGLAYSIGSAFVAMQFPGSFQVVMQTKNASAGDAVRRVCAEIDRIRTEPVSDEELAGAKQYLTGSFPLRLDTTSKIAGFLSQVEFFQLGPDYVDRYAERITAVSKDDVLRVAREHLHPQRINLVVVGDLTQATVPDAPACGGAAGN